ncbi:MAG TPA: GNAT family N-acetyltransferase [Jiangellaceae bacterium]|nr:GNAT family N-acetyltransferase [Jiangellaceae bacterium]
MRPAAHMVDVRPVTDEDRPAVVDILTRSWGATSVAAHGVLHDAATLPGLIATQSGRAVGLLTVQVEDGDWEVVTLDAVDSGRGIGTALLRSVEQAARAAGARRLWLITTNDNTRALRFYQRGGFDLVALHRDAVTRSRATVKPSIPLEVDGIPLRHELELERILRCSGDPVQPAAGVLGAAVLEVQ